MNGLARFLLRRTLFAAALVAVVASAALVFASLAPSDSALDADPAAARAERARLGLDRPVGAQYVGWLARAARLDFGESLRFGRPVGALVRERAANTARLGLTALLLATAAGIPLGVFTGSRRQAPLSRVARALTATLLACPPLVTSLVLMLIAIRTGWLPITSLWLPAIALALPVAASLERQQSQAIGEALEHPALLAARARGVPERLVVWRHAWRLSLTPLLAVYGITIGGLLSGSFAVEIVTGWPGLGALTFEALRARDSFLVAGCAAAGAACLAAGILLSDLALSFADPRLEDLS